MSFWWDDPPEKQPERGYVPAFADVDPDPDLVRPSRRRAQVPVRGEEPVRRAVQAALDRTPESDAALERLAHAHPRAAGENALEYAERLARLGGLTR